MKLDLIARGNPDSPTKILFLHGGPGMGPSYFLPYFDGLAKDAELFFYTQGSSGADTIEGLVDEIDVALPHCRGGHIFILGHSFGGALALEYVKRRGADALDGLILMSWVHEMKARHFKDYKDDEDFCAKTAAIAEQYFSPSHVDEGRKILSASSYDLSLHHKINETFFNAFSSANVLKQLDRPILSVAGTDDHVVSLAHVRRGCGFNAKIKAVEIAGVGHFPFMEKREEVLAAIREFVLRKEA
jgi:pimeloyl-ACP methyl ester carboxylesterase